MIFFLKGRLILRNIEEDVHEGAKTPEPHVQLQASSNNTSSMIEGVLSNQSSSTMEKLARCANLLATPFALELIQRISKEVKASMRALQSLIMHPISEIFSSDPVID